MDASPALQRPLIENTSEMHDVTPGDVMPVNSQPIGHGPPAGMAVNTRQHQRGSQLKRWVQRIRPEAESKCVMTTHQCQLYCSNITVHD